MSAICTSPANFTIARAPDDFSEIYIEWSHIVRAPAGVFICKHRPMPDRAPYDVVKIVRCPSDVCKRRPGAVRTPYGARPMSFYPQ